MKTTKAEIAAGLAAEEFRAEGLRRTNMSLSIRHLADTVELLHKRKALADAMTALADERAEVVRLRGLLADRINDPKLHMTLTIEGPEQARLALEAAVFASRV